MNFDVLAKLAGVNDSVEIFKELGLTQETIVNNEFSSALKELQEEERKAALKGAAKEVIGLMKSVKEQMDDIVKQIRSVRSKEKFLLSAIKNMQRAQEYAYETNNYIPLVVALQYEYPSRQATVIGSFGAKATIPEDWKPKTGNKPVTRAAAKK